MIVNKGYRIKATGTKIKGYIDDRVIIEIALFNGSWKLVKAEGLPADLLKAPVTIRCFAAAFSIVESRL